MRPRFFNQIFFVLTKEKSVDLSAKAKKTDATQPDDVKPTNVDDVKMATAAAAAAEAEQKNSKSDLNEPVEVEEIGSDDDDGVEDEEDDDDDDNDKNEDNIEVLIIFGFVSLVLILNPFLFSLCLVK